MASGESLSPAEPHCWSWVGLRRRIEDQPGNVLTDCLCTPGAEMHLPETSAPGRAVT